MIRRHCKALIFANSSVFEMRKTTRMSFICQYAAFLLTLQMSLCIGKPESFKFLPKSICGNHGTLEGHPYSEADYSTTAIIGCVQRCHKELAKGVACIGAGVDRAGVCYKLRVFDKKTAQASCPEDEQIKVLVVEKSCENGGMWDGLRSRCQCFKGWVGERCHRYGHDCKELLSYDYPTVELLKVTLDMPGLGMVSDMFCILSGKPKFGLTVFLMNAGLGNTNRTYSDYVDGFYEKEHVLFWLGLKVMHHVISRVKRNIVDFAVRLGNEKQQVQLSQHYYNFVMKDASGGYAFNYQSAGKQGKTGSMPTNQTIKDCFGAVRGVPFSTADHDRDQSLSDNCAARAGVGWWFKDCSLVCNIMGQRPNDANLGKPESILNVMDPMVYQYFGYTLVGLIDIQE